LPWITQENKRVAGDKLKKQEEILAKNKNVIVIGGGDTGSDCVGTANRQGAKSVTQIELLSKPPKERTEKDPWPLWPVILRTSSSHKEGCERKWALNTKAFIGLDGAVKSIQLVEIEWEMVGGRQTMKEVPNSETFLPCELALIAIGFVHPQKEGLLAELGVELDNRGNVKCSNYNTTVEKVFAAGDMRRGQSLVVWAISEGREAARAVDEFLVGNSILESKSMSLVQE